MEAQGMIHRFLPVPGAVEITGFDVNARAWLTATCTFVSLARLPLLGGRLLVDDVAQSRAVDSDGKPARQRIAAMLLPASVEDIVRMTSFCHRHGIVMTSPYADGEAAPGPIVRIHADARGRQRPVLRVVVCD